ncbi:SGNH/GDSL hydrolase family protein [Danxiaibacter flavus]|uniref:SGNH/GDSL hydrolase family protein n=1 Tax=Danxiaibacter flavus TaxID=3049108 RepID=A0ABV3ZGP1_9BACT|nr:SGNH/GDSL hydrolase family protein [Chitinophagaceae bacterium DXS]
MKYTVARFCCVIFLACVSFFSFCQHPVSFHTDKWKGFARVNFLLEDHAAYYVKPAKALPGNPWVWRTSFPDWHTEMDSLLLAKGFHIVFLNVDNQYGSPSAMRLYNKLYQYLTDSVSFAHTVALEAVSRGGLYAYAWAKRNPDKVNCIYAEAPVCDIKSWPGGKGKGPGDSTCWNQFLQIFSLTEQQALLFKDNPVDNLEGMAAFKIPVLHVIGYDDRLLPSDENTYMLAQRYTALGGPMSIYPVTMGPQELSGHHFPIEHAGKWADFIAQNAYPANDRLPYGPYVNKRNGLQNSFNAIHNNKEATVAFLGGSITYNPGWRDKICRYLKEHYPDTKFHFIAAGIPSLGSLPHSFRLQRDVLDSGKVDLLFVETAVNDRVNGTDSLTQMLALEGIVRHARRTNPQMDIVLMSFADEQKNDDYGKGITPVEIANLERVAAHYGLPSLNMAKEVHDKIRNKEFTWTYDFKDVHPSPYGQELYAATIKTLLNNCFNDNNLNKQSSQTTMAAPLTKQSIDNGGYVDIHKAGTDNGWKIDENWEPSDGLSTRDGFAHMPVLVGDKPGAVLSFKFKGNAVGIAIVSGSDAGMITYSIDNGAPKTINLYTQWSNLLHLPWYLLLGSELKNTNHTLHIKIADSKDAKSKGNACRIVHFLVNG